MYKIMYNFMYNLNFLRKNQGISRQNADIIAVRLADE